MSNTIENKKAENLRIEIKGKPVRLYFLPEINYDAAPFIKKTLMTAYLIKAV